MPKARARLAPTTSMISDADHGEDDLRLHHGRLALRRAAASRTQRQRGAEQRRQRQPDQRRQDLLLEVVHHSREIDCSGPFSGSLAVRTEAPGLPGSSI